MAARRGLLTAALLLVAVAHPPPIAAADDIQILPGVTLTALTADLDADGARELIRLVDRPDGGYGVESWVLDGATWTKASTAPLIPLLEDGARPASDVGDIGALLLWRRDGLERVVALSAVASPVNLGDVCCMALSEVSTGPNGVVLVPLPGAFGGPQIVQSADLDGDGTDEIVTEGTTYGGGINDPGNTVRQVLRWDGAAFERVHLSEQSGPSFGIVVGETDGGGGVELLMGPTDAGTLQRIAWRDGRVLLEETHLDLGERGGGWVAGAANGVIAVGITEGMRVVRWPAGSAARITGRIDSFELPWIFSLGDGPDALILTADGLGFAGTAEPTVTVHDQDLRELGSVAADPRFASLWEMLHASSQRGYGSLGINITPYVGPFPAVQNGHSAFALGGSLIEAGRGGSFEVRPFAGLIGAQPIGFAGPGDAWLATGEWTAGGFVAYLIPTAHQASGSGRLALTPWDAFIRPEGIDASIRIEGAVERSRDDSEAILAAGPMGFGAVVTAPPGSIVVATDGSAFEEHEVTGEPVVLEIEPPQNRSAARDVAFERWIIVIGPDGRALSEHWEGTFVREAPELVADAQTEAFGSTATISGRASSGAEVIVDGLTAEFDDRGAFRVEVDAPIWPRDVVVIARDVLGNETSARLQVVGFLDYRGLPWVAILALATLAAGAFLFVRTPGRRAQPTAAWGDAALEEIDAD